ncbi:MAG: efflux RND transporter permease subunit, partial [Planctomycetes bacterium]|nr:efflux RND transporter permease subunit [Planctomycetota bacterium]
MKSLPQFSVENPVLVGVVMASILIGGVYAAFTLVREMFPESRPNQVLISTLYPGATPSEVEKGVAMRLEEAIKDVEHIEKVETFISEGACTLAVTLTFEADDLDQAVNDFKAAIDTIPRDELPEDAEEIRVRRAEPRLPVISVALFGDVNEGALKAAGQKLRDELLLLPGLSDVVQPTIVSDESEGGRPLGLGQCRSLIVKLGGDSNRRKLKRISWEEGVETICSELNDKGRSSTYVGTLRRIMSDLRAITGVDDLRAIDLDIIAKWRSVRMKGGWMRDGFPTRPIKGSSINTELGIISSFIERAVRKRWAIRNVLRNAVDERVKVRSPRVDYMPDDDLRKILAAADPWMRAFIIVAYYSAARRGDLLRLEWDRDVDLDGSKAAAEGRIGPHLFVRGHKADTPRWIPIHYIAISALRELRQQPRISPRVFDRCDVTSLQCKVSNEFASIVRGAGLPHLTLHGLRHAHATLALTAGINPKTVAERSGHASVVITLDTYSHVLP